MKLYYAFHVGLKVLIGVGLAFFVVSFVANYLFLPDTAPLAAHLILPLQGLVAAIVGILISQYVRAREVAEHAAETDEHQAKIGGVISRNLKITAANVLFFAVSIALVAAIAFIIFPTSFNPILPSLLIGTFLLFSVLTNVISRPLKLMGQKTERSVYDDFAEQPNASTNKRLILDSFLTQGLLLLATLSAFAILMAMHIQGFNFGFAEKHSVVQVTSAIVIGVALPIICNWIIPFIFKAFIQRGNHNKRNSIDSNQSEAVVDESHELYEINTSTPQQNVETIVLLPPKKIKYGYGSMEQGISLKS